MKKLLIVLPFLFFIAATIFTTNIYAASQADQTPIDYKDIDKLCPNPNEECPIDPKTYPNSCNVAKTGNQCSGSSVAYSCPTEPCIPFRNTPLGFKTELGWSQPNQNPISFNDIDKLCPNQDETCPINPSTITDPNFCNSAIKDCTGAKTIYNCPSPCTKVDLTPKNIKTNVLKYGPVGDLAITTPFGTLDPSNLEKTASSIAGFATGLALIAAIYLLITGGLKVMTSSGQPDKLADGKETITSALIGLAFIALAIALLQIIGGALLLPGF